MLFASKLEFGTPHDVTVYKTFEGPEDGEERDPAPEAYHPLEDWELQLGDKAYVHHGEIQSPPFSRRRRARIQSQKPVAGSWALSSFLCTSPPSSSDCHPSHVAGQIITKRQENEVFNRGHVFQNKIIDHVRARVEHVIGRIKGRFSALHGRWRRDYELLSDVVQIACQMEQLHVDLYGERYEGYGDWPHDL